MAQDEEVVPLQLLGNDPRQYGLAVRNEITLHFLLISEVRSQAVQFLGFVEDLDQRADVVVLQLCDGQVDEVESVEGLVGVLVHEFELYDQHVFLQLGLLVGRHWVLADLGQLPCLLLVKDAVFQVRLSESGVHLVYLLDADVLWDHAMPRQHCFPLIAHVPLFGPHRRIARRPASFPTRFCHLVIWSQWASQICAVVKGLRVQVEI